MELLNTDFFGEKLRLDGSMAGWQRLFWGGQLVSELAASPNEESLKIHRFQMLTQTGSTDVPPAQKRVDGPVEKGNEGVMDCRLEVDLRWQPFDLKYNIFVDEVDYLAGERNSKDIEQQVPEQVIVAKTKFSLVGLGILALKLLKSAKLIKVALAGASLAAYAWLFSLQFALSLLACLVVHEYGHIRAMKYFKMPTKGIYLIPFFGGMALSDGKINTRWQDVVISIMGPIFGLGMSLLSVLAYWLTGNVFFAGLAVFNSLLNMFNLLPILPLDGGHILKSVSFSMNSKVGLVVCILAVQRQNWQEIEHVE